MDQSEAFWSRSELLFTQQEASKLAGAVIAVAGIGGVGCMVVEMIARLGIRSLRVADPELFETSNLNRQIFATASTLGRNKAAVAAERVRDINPDCEVRVFDQGVTRTNVEDFVTGADLVFSQTDRFAPMVLLHRVCKSSRIPLLHGCRSDFPGCRWEVTATAYDYRNDDVLDFESMIQLPSAGISMDELDDHVLAELERKMSGAMREKLNRAVADSDYRVFRPVAPDPGHFERFVGDGRNTARTVCAPISNTAALLAVMEGVRLLLGWGRGQLTVNLIA